MSTTMRGHDGEGRSSSLLAAALLLAFPLVAFAGEAKGNGKEARDGEAAPAKTEAEQVEEVASPTDFHFYWKDGIRFETADKAFSFAFGGRIQNDWAASSGDDALEAAVGALEGGTEFRRARLYLSGTVYRRVEFKTQFDFAGGDVVFKDVYLGVTKIPGLGGIRVGHFKEPFSLEELTSSKYITFMERSLPSLFFPSRNTGLMLHDHVKGDRVTWAAGAFLDTDDTGRGIDPDSYSVTARVTGLPWHDGPSRLVHLGVSASYRRPGDGTLRYRQRPEVHLSPRFVDTKSFAADAVRLVDVEAALVSGPFSAQGEWIEAMTDAPALGDPAFRGYYLQASYFLTGESRAYKTSSGAFDRVKPKANFGAEGPGAWEVAVRYSWLDLDAAPVEGGVLRNVTLGLNWHLNPVTRFMVNYVFADRDAVGDARFLQARFQIDF